LAASGLKKKNAFKTFIQKLLAKRKVGKFCSNPQLSLE